VSIFSKYFSKKSGLFFSCEDKTSNKRKYSYNLGLDLEGKERMVEA
jgi:hypothetical protein